MTAILQTNPYGITPLRGWCQSTLGEVVKHGASFIQTGPFGSQLHAHDYKAEGVPVVMPQQLGDNRVELDGIARISEEDRDRLARHVMEEGDIVFSRRGDVTRRAFITSQEAGYLCGTGCLLIRLKHPDIDNQFLSLFFSLPQFKDYITQKAVGATMPNLNTGILERIPLLLPTIAEQRRIVATLTAYDGLMENNRRRMGLLEESARLLYREWFVRLRFPGHEHTRIVGGVPEGWARKTLGDIVEVNRSTLPSSFDGEIDYVDIASVVPGQITATTTYTFRDAPSRARRIVEHGDVIWSCVRPNRRSHAVIWKPADNLIVSTGFAVITPVSAPSTFVYFATTTDAFVGYLENHARGAAYPAVLAADFERAEVLVPPKGLLDTFNEVIEPAFSQMHNLRQQNQKLRAARDLLLPRLMSGEIAI